LDSKALKPEGIDEDDSVPHLVVNFDEASRNEAKIFSGFWKLAWTRFNKSAMCFLSFTHRENIACYSYSNINISYINNAVSSEFFDHFILHFALLPGSFLLVAI
jgi:hypothetical protein